MTPGEVFPVDQAAEPPIELLAQYYVLNGAALQLTRLQSRPMNQQGPLRKQSNPHQGWVVPLGLTEEVPGKGRAGDLCLVDGVALQLTRLQAKGPGQALTLTCCCQQSCFFFAFLLRSFLLSNRQFC